jgi:ribosomal-protein-alanine N-acetyltransferase
MYRLLQRSEDIASQLHQLSEESYAHGSPWTEEQFQSTLKQEHLFYILAESEAELIGFLAGSMIHQEAEIYNIVVSKEYKRQGIGSKLMSEMKRMLQVNGVRELFLEVRVSNKPAILLYKSFGFQPVGVRKNYYSKPREDAVVLKCTLLDKENE